MAKHDFDLGLDSELADSEEALLSEVNFFDANFDAAEKVPDRYSTPQVEAILSEVIDILAEARPLPMSATVKVNRDELLHMLEQVSERLPEELRAARWLLKERDDFVDKARQEHADLIAEGRAQVARMVEREEVVKAAEVRAREIIAEARDETHLMKRQIEEYCSERLGNIEAIMEKTILTMRQGRQTLLGSSEQSGDSVSRISGDDSEDDSSVEQIDLRRRKRRAFR